VEARQIIRIVDEYPVGLGGPRGVIAAIVPDRIESAPTAGLSLLAIDATKFGDAGIRELVEGPPGCTT
jgi:hypothetical protein